MFENISIVSKFYFTFVYSTGIKDVSTVKFAKWL